MGRQVTTRRRRRRLRSADDRARSSRLSRRATRRTDARSRGRGCDDLPGVTLRQARRRRDRVLRRGVDFDHVVLAVSMGMLPVVANELIEDRPEWRDMTTHVRTVATQAFQLWLRPDEPRSDGRSPASRSAPICARSRPGRRCRRRCGRRTGPTTIVRGTVAYFCGSLDAPWPTTEDHASYTRRYAGPVSPRGRRLHRPQPRPVLSECRYGAGLCLASALRRQTVNAVRRRWRPNTSA